MISRTSSAFAVVAVLTIVCAAITSAQSDLTSADAQIRDLMTQKRNVLQERLDWAEQLYKLGSIKADRVLNARKDLLNAKLDLATSVADRVAVLDSQLKNLRELEQLIASRGTAKSNEKLIAKANRIDGEIALLREKAKR